MLLEQHDILFEQTTRIQNEINSYTDIRDNLIDNITSLKLEVQSLEATITKHNTKLALLVQSLKNSQDELVKAQKQLEQVKNSKNTLLQDNEVIQAVMRETKVKTVSLNGEIEKNQHILRETIVKQTTIQEELKSKIQDSEAKLQRLRQEINDIGQKIEQRRNEDLAIRKKLALWEKSLAEKDRNLRIRQTKISNSEDIIIQNSNLLNL